MSRGSVSMIHQLRNVARRCFGAYLERIVDIGDRIANVVGKPPKYDTPAQDVAEAQKRMTHEHVVFNRNVHITGMLILMASFAIIRYTFHWSIIPTVLVLIGLLPLGLVLVTVWM
jgi:hypothetical protein